MSKLKAVWDAVNELRGDLLGSTYANTHKENYKTLDVYLHVVLTNDYDPQPIGSFVIYSSNESARGDVRFICTIAEFNALVEDMTLGLDVNPVNHGHYLNYVDADKALLEKENNPLVYTQEMADNHLAPRVGCIFMVVDSIEDDSRLFDFKGEEVEVIGLSVTTLNRQVITFQHPLIGIGCGVYNASWVKPVDTRTKKEKAIDDIANLLIADKAIESKQAYDIAISILNVASDGDIYGVKWVGE